MGRNYALTLPECREAASLYALGKSMEQIAEAMGVSRTAVRSALVMLNVNIRPRSEARKTIWTVNEIRLRCVEDRNECWIWQYSKKPNGYGYLNICGKMTYAHRLSFSLAHGPIPKGKDVCHECDVRSCVNPDHLFLGTRTDNMRDARDKGRLSVGILHGLRVKAGISKRRESTRLKLQDQQA